jgi:hypothetical protein
MSDVSMNVSPSVIDHLLRSGCAALVWRYVRDTPWEKSAAFEPLHQAARTYALRAALNSRQLAELTRAMRAAEAEPLLFKGWAAARLYAEPALRPLGDVDLCVRPAHRDVALVVVRAFAASDHPYVDLHSSFPDLPDRSLDEVFAHSRLVPLDDVEIRVLSPEDHLRCVALHFFRHAATRPLSLCDIGAALESIPPDFDWEYCLRGDVRLTDRVVRAMGLAATLLGARLPASVLVAHAESLPRWLVRAVLRQWGSPSYEHYVNRPLIECLRRRGEVIPALRRRWPSAIQLTVDHGATIGAFPPLALQLWTTFSHTLGFARRAWRMGAFGRPERRVVAGSARPNG